MHTRISLPDVRLSAPEWRCDEVDLAPDDWRIDDGGAPLAKARIDADTGFMHLDGIAAAPGVYVYRNADGTTRRELVSADMLQAWASTAGHATLTLGHPPGGRVDSTTAKQHSIGEVRTSSYAPGAGVRVSAIARDEAAIQRIKGGWRALSFGYSVRMDWTPGVHPRFGAYDGVQHRDPANHLASCKAGRGGPTCRVRVDSGDDTTTDTTGAGMTLEQLQAVLIAEGLRADSVSEARASIQTLKADATSRNDAADAATTRADAAEGQLVTARQVLGLNDGVAITAESAREAVNATVKRMDSYRKVAAVKGITLPADADAATLRATIAKGLGADAETLACPIRSDAHIRALGTVTNVGRMTVDPAPNSRGARVDSTPDGGSVVVGI